MAGLGYGAGRFLPQELEAYQSMLPPQQGGALSAPAQSLAFQPNYPQFWNPTSMLQMGAPQFASPWYNQINVPSMVPQSPSPPSQTAAGPFSWSILAKRRKWLTPDMLTAMRNYEE